MSDSQPLRHLGYIEVQVDLRGEIPLPAGQNLTIVLPVDGGAVTLLHPFPGDLHRAPSQPPLPVHNADARVIQVLCAAAALFFVGAVGMIEEGTPPPGALVELRPAGAAGCATG